MPDALNRARRYRALSAGCRRLAEIGQETETRSHFLRMAERYSMLARAEESTHLRARSAAARRR